MAFKIERSDCLEISSEEGQSMVPDMLHCDPCSEDGNYVQVEGYCVDCEQYLCNLCFQHHLRPKPCRKHRLLDRQRMPLTKPVKFYKDECTDKCGTHKDKIIEYFCEDHKVLGCTVCVTLEHRACTAGYIPNLSDNLFESLEYKQFKVAVDTLANRIKTFQGAVTQNLNDIKTNADKAMVEVRQFRQEIDSYFDELERIVSEKILQNQMEDRQNIQTVSEHCDKLAEEIGELNEQINDKKMKNQKCRLFVDIKRLHKSIDNHKTTLETLEMNNKVKANVFIPSKAISDLIYDSQQQFGSLVSVYGVIPFSMDTDPNESCIHGIATLSNGKIAVTDSKNKCVKILDIKQGRTTMSKSMDHFTYGITAISENEIAVTRARAIEIYSIGDQITLKKTIYSADLHWSLIYINNKFIGSSMKFPFSVRMVNMKGEVMKIYPIELNGEQLFGYPWKMAINKDHTLIYVSDLGTETVTCLSIEGQVKARYKHKSRWIPKGVAVTDDGLVYINDSYNNVIHILTADLKEMRVIDGKPYGIKNPNGLAYCQRERKLYVGMNPEIVVLNI